MSHDSCDRPLRRVPGLLAAIAFCSLHVQAVANESGVEPVLDATVLAKRIHARINEQRRAHGMDALGWDEALARIAQAHSRDMAHRDYLGHDTPEGESFGDRYRKAGFGCSIPIGKLTYSGAENVALTRQWNRATTTGDGVTRYEWNSPEEIVRVTVDNWMRSEGHRANILRPYWRQEGIGVEIGPGNKVLITQNFC